jgi:prepilin-type N-terminal cleavage/methylation domain-containing protein
MVDHHSLRSILDDERGFTLTELLVAMSILSIVMLVFTTTLASVQKAVSNQQIRSSNNDNTRLALENMDRLVRSGNVLFDPSVTNTDCKPTGSAFQCLLVYTQANGTTARLSRCIQWRVEGTDLQERWWLPRTGAGVSQKTATQTAWRLIAEGIVNLSTSPVTRTFALDPDPLKQGRSVQVLFLVGTSSDGANGALARTEASLTARNTTYGYLADACS